MHQKSKIFCKDRGTTIPESTKIWGKKIKGQLKELMKASDWNHNGHAAGNYIKISQPKHKQNH